MLDVDEQICMETELSKTYDYAKEQQYSVWNK
jgi:hypothetical protein